MANNFMQGMQMSMQMARDIRSANLAQADRAEQKEYRDMRMKALKAQRRRGKKADKRAESADKRADKADKRAGELHTERIAAMKQAAKKNENPMVNAYENYRRLLESHETTIKAADTRHALRVSPVNKSIENHFGTWEEYAHKVAVRDQMVEDHKQFKAGLEHSFMAASNRPYQGTVSVAPYVDQTGQQHYGVKLEGADLETAEAFHKKFSGIASKRPPMGIGGLPFGTPTGTPTGTPNAKQPAASGAAQQLTDPNIDKFLQ